MAGKRVRFGPQRGVGSGSIRPKSGVRGNFPNPRRTKGALGNLLPNLRIPGVNVKVIPRVRTVTFDRNIIKTNWKAINRNPLQKAANLIRMRARGSIRRVGRFVPPGPPGSPPKSRFGSHGRKANRIPGTPPFKMIFNVPTKLGTGQIIGMVGFNLNPTGELPAPGLQEHGGTARRFLRNRKRIREPQRRGPGGKFLPKQTPIRTSTKQRIRLPPRPFMKPALRQLVAEGRLPRFWRNSLRGRSATRV